MKKNLTALLALLLVFALSVSGCSADKAEEAPAAAPEQQESANEGGSVLGVKTWELSASTWSSPNGATVHLTATPFEYTEGDTAWFIVRLEGEDVEKVPCQWDGTNYTASVDLNAADGYCYYFSQMSENSFEMGINTPTSPVDDALINLYSALQSYCTLTVNASESADGKLSITDGNVKIQLPQISNDGETILCEKAVLVLTLGDKEVSSFALGVGEPVDGGMHELSIAGTTFDIPRMEDDQRLELRLDVTLSNNQTLTATGGSWLMNDGNLLLAAG